MTLSLESQTYVPEREHEGDLHDLRELLVNNLSETEGFSSVRAALVGANPDEGVALPLEVVMALLQIVSALESGRAVTVEPHSVLLTTQQAADLLGVSRPTIVKLINSGELRAEQITTRRQIHLRDLLEYRERRKRAQYAAIEATSVDLDDEDNPEEIRRRLREVRKRRAAERRSKPAQS